MNVARRQAILVPAAFGSPGGRSKHRLHTQKALMEFPLLGRANDK